MEDRDTAPGTDVNVNVYCIVCGYITRRLIWHLLAAWRKGARKGTREGRRGKGGRGMATNTSSPSPPLTTSGGGCAISDLINMKTDGEAGGRFQDQSTIHAERAGINRGKHPIWTFRQCTYLSLRGNRDLGTVGEGGGGVNICTVPRYLSRLRTAHARASVTPRKKWENKRKLKIQMRTT